MAEIQRYRRGSLGILAPRERTRAGDISGMVRGMEQAADVVDRYAERMRAADENNLKLQVDDILRKQRTEYSTLKAGQARGIARQFSNTRDDFIQSFVDKAESPLTKENIRLYANRKFNNTAEWVANYQIEQDDEYRKNIDVATRDSISKDINEVPVSNLTDAINEGVQTATNEFVKREGATEPQRLNYENAFRDQLVTSQLINRFLETPSEAVEYWDANRETFSKQLSAKALNEVERMYKAAAPRAKYQNALRFLHSTYGNDHAGKYRYLSDPAIEEKHDITATQRMTLQSQMAGMINFEYQQTQRFRMERQREEADRIETHIAEGNMDLAEQAIANSKHLDPNQRMQWRNNLNTFEVRPDPEKVTKLYMDIAEGRVTTHPDIAMKIGQGVGLNMSPFHSLLDRMQAANENGAYTNRFQSILQKYDALTRSKKPEEKVDPALRGEFKEVLLARMLEQNLTPYSIELYGIAQEELKRNHWRVGSAVFLDQPWWTHWPMTMIPGLETGEAARQFEKTFQDVYSRSTAPIPTQPAPPPTGTVAAPPSRTGAETPEQQQTTITLEQFEENPWSIPGDTVDQKIDNFFNVFPDYEDTEDSRNYLRSIIETAVPVE